MKFDVFVEARCAKLYAEKYGIRRGPPDVHFRCLLAGYSEGTEAERGIVQRVGDSLGLRDFLGIPLDERTSD